jgi:DNA-binding transcriptional LysR family regulator
LTKALRLLEEELGAPLVVRTPHGARLAPAGELLAARAAAALRELDRGREEVSAWAGGADARVTVGLSPAAAVLLAPGAIARLAARWPQVQVRLLDALFPRSTAMLRSGELDFAIGPIPSDLIGTDLSLRPLFDSRTVVVARRGHPLVRARRLAALVDARWVTTGPAGGPGDPGSLGFDALGLPVPRPWLACESFSTVLAMVGSLDAVCAMPNRFFERHGARLGLVRLPIADPLPESTIQVAWRTDAPLTHPARRLMDAFVQEAKDASAGPVSGAGRSVAAAR